MKIKKFLDFITESYLEGSRQPLYHLTYRLVYILDSDLLKCGKPSRATHGKDKSISVTRNIDFSHDGALISEIIELDADKLMRAGIRPYPADEIGSVTKNNKTRNFSKSNFDEVKLGKRGTKHGLDLPTDPVLETEFEERIFQDIPNLGRYMMSINLQRPNSNRNRALEVESKISEYLKKYPHIKVFEFDPENRRKKTDITYRFQDAQANVTQSVE
jgi:hypothetical protein